MYYFLFFTNIYLVIYLSCFRLIQLTDISAFNNNLCY